VHERSTIMWRRLDMPGAEVAELTCSSTLRALAGVVVVAHDGRPCALEYHIVCDAAWQTETVSIRGHLGGTAAALEIARSSNDSWRVNGTPAPTLQGCVDVDLGFSPATNLLPIRRLNLSVGERAAVRAAWVRFPELTLEILEQTYARVAEESYMYESAGGTFRRELIVNPVGFVVDYPDYWRAEAMTIDPAHVA
jgi:hypothetical protein